MKQNGHPRRACGAAYDRSIRCQAFGGTLDVGPAHDAVRVDQELAPQLGPLPLPVSVVGRVVLIPVAEKRSCSIRARSIRAGCSMVAVEFATIAAANNYWRR
jgi:hypothetical protein